MRRRIATCLILLAPACGSTSSSDPDAGVDAVSYDAAVADAAPPDAMADPTLDDLCGLDGGFVAYFEAMLACYPEFELFLGRWPTHAEISAACYGQFEPYFDDGTMSLADAAAWALCLDHIANLDCLTAEFDAPTPCTALILGSQAEDQPCEEDDQCAGDAYCDRSGGGDCGACAPLRADWQPCDTGQQCASRLCDSTWAVCRPFGQIGAVCANDDECSGHLICDTGVTDQCITPPVWQAGDECADLEADCGFPLSDLFCDVEGLEGTLECVPYFSVGDSCVSLWQCDFRHYETCDVGDSDECIAPTIVGDGQSCGFWDGRQCAEGFRCTDPTEGTGLCAPEPQIGDSCETSDDCGILMDCDSASQCAYGEYSGLCPDAG